jgi:hypothetical protein
MQLDIVVVKGKQTLTIDTDKLPDDIVPEIYALGLKQLLNRGMSEVTKANIPDKEELEAEAMAVAAQNLQNIYDGKIRRTAGTKASSKGETKEVQAEARKEAQLAVKDAIKAAGKKVSLVASKEITRLTNDLLKSEEGKEIWERAKAVIEARKAKKAEQPALSINLAGLREDPKLVEAAAKKKEAAKSTRKGTKAKGKGAAGQHASA